VLKLTLTLEVVSEPFKSLFLLGVGSCIFSVRCSFIFLIIFVDGLYVLIRLKPALGLSVVNLMEFSSPLSLCSLRLLLLVVPSFPSELVVSGVELGGFRVVERCEGRYFIDAWECLDWCLGYPLGLSFVVLAVVVCVCCGFLEGEDMPLETLAYQPEF